MKNFLLAVFIGFLLMYALGDTLSDWFGIHLMMDSEMFTPLENLLVFSAIAVLFVIIGFVVAISVVGAMALAVFAVVAALAVAGIGMFWPVLLFAGVLWLLFRDKEKKNNYRENY